MVSVIILPLEYILIFMSVSTFFCHILYSEFSFQYVAEGSLQQRIESQYTLTQNTETNNTRPQRTATGLSRHRLTNWSEWNFWHLKSKPKQIAGKLDIVIIHLSRHQFSIIFYFY
mgnify:FL=1